MGMHGGGGVGSDILRLRGQASQVWRGIDKYRKGPCYVVAPQAQKRAREKGGWVPKDLNVLLEHLKSTLKVDENRIYLTGNSMGGYGSWIWIMGIDQNHKSREWLIVWFMDHGIWVHISRKFFFSLTHCNRNPFLILEDPPLLDVGWRKAFFP